MNSNNIQSMVQEMYGEPPLVTWMRTASAAEKLELVEGMDAEEASITDPEMKAAVAAEHSVLRMMLRVYS